MSFLEEAVKLDIKPDVKPEVTPVRTPIHIPKSIEPPDYVPPSPGEPEAEALAPTPESSAALEFRGEVKPAGSLSLRLVTLPPTPEEEAKPDVKPDVNADVKTTVDPDVQPDVKPDVKAKAPRKRKRKADLLNLDADADAGPKKRRGAPLPRLPRPICPPPVGHEHRAAPATPAKGLARVSRRVLKALFKAKPRGKQPLSHYHATLAGTRFANADILAQLGKARWRLRHPGKDRAYTSVATAEEGAVPLALTLGGVVHRALGAEEGARVLHAADNATHTLCQAIIPHVPHANSRFGHLDHSTLKDRFDAQGEAYGVLHFADWLEQGHPDKGVQSAADLNTDRNWKTRAKMGWFRALRPLWPIVEEALKTLDGACHERYKNAAAKLEEDSYLQLNLVSFPARARWPNATRSTSPLVPC